LDYEQVRKQALAHEPLIILAGYSSYPRRLNFRIFREICDEVGAVLMVDMAHFAGLVAGKVMSGEEDPVAYADIVTSTTHKTLRGPRGGLVLCREWLADAVDRGCPLVLGGPLPHVIAAKAVALELASQPSFAAYASAVADNAQVLAGALETSGITVVSGGTDNHLVICDVRPLGLTGRQAEGALTQCGITANRNVIPGESHGAWYTSGIRLGTAALTSRGMGLSEMTEIAALIGTVLTNTTASVKQDGTPSEAKFETTPDVVDDTTRRVHELLDRFPLYPDVTRFPVL
jgi:glycine hydroxymethyltransferase